MAVITCLSQSPSGFLTNISTIFLLFSWDILPSMPLDASLPLLCLCVSSFQLAPGCQLIVDNYSYLTAAFTASAFLQALTEGEHAKQKLPLWRSTHRTVGWKWENIKCESGSVSHMHYELARVDFAKTLSEPKFALICCLKNKCQSCSDIITLTQL